MKPISVLILMACIFAGVAQIYADEEAPAPAAAEPVAEEIPAPAKVAEPIAEEASAPIEAAKDIIEAVEDMAEAILPGAASPKVPDFAAKMIEIIKNKVEAFKLALSEDKEIHPIFKAAVERMKVKRQADDLNVSCISGFNEELAQLFDLIHNNQVMSYCQSDLGSVNELCPKIVDPMSAVLTKLYDLVHLVMNFCQNMPPCV